MDDLLKMYNAALAERLADAANPVKMPVQNLHLDWPTDPDLSARANAELVKGFPVKVYHHAD